MAKSAGESASESPGESTGRARADFIQRGQSTGWQRARGSLAVSAHAPCSRPVGRPGYLASASATVVVGAPEVTFPQGSEDDCAAYSARSPDGSHEPRATWTRPDTVHAVAELVGSHVYETARRTKRNRAQRTKTTDNTHDSRTHGQKPPMCP